MTRRSLGRGLDALIQSTDGPGYDAAAVFAALEADNGSGIATGIGIQMVPPAQIVPGRFQPRQYFNEQALSELAAAIKAQGIIEPLIVRPMGDGYELIAGERRLRAARLAELDAVPVIVREVDDRAALEMSLVENLLREDLNLVEEGRAFQRLNEEFGLIHDEIAARIGRSRSYVTNIIRLLDLPGEILDMVGRGELSAGQVRPLLALNSPEAQLAEARKMAAEKISSRQAEAIASTRRRGGSRSAAAEDPNVRAVTDALQRALKRKVRLVLKRGTRPGRLELEYYNDDDLVGLTRTLTAGVRAASA